MLDLILDFLKIALPYAMIGALLSFLRRRDARRAAEPAGRRAGRIVVGGWLAGPTADVCALGIAAASAAFLVTLLGVMIRREVAEEGSAGAVETILIAGFFAALIGAGGIAAARAALRRATWTAEADTSRIASYGHCMTPSEGRWENLRSVRQTLLSGWLIFEFGDARQVMVLQQTRGLDELIAFARDRAPGAAFRLDPASPGG